MTRMALPLRIKCEWNEIPRVTFELKTLHLLVVVITRKNDHIIGGGAVDSPINAIVQTNPSSTIVHLDPAWMMEEKP